MLQITNLTKSYSQSGNPAVEDLRLEVRPGEIFGFIGPNGAGKSTTIKCITGILSYEKGNVKICGVDLKHNLIEAKRLIGYVSDDHVLYERLTGLEFIDFICDMFGVPEALRKQRLDKYMNTFELAHAINEPIKSYSHGMKQKLNLIGALIHEPKLWILDEPMTGLDPKSAYNLKTLMREHADAGNSVFFSSHVLDVVEKVCDRVGIIDKGRLITECSVEDLHTRGLSKSLEELFLQITENREYADSFAKSDIVENYTNK